MFRRPLMIEKVRLRRLAWLGLSFAIFGSARVSLFLSHLHEATVLSSICACCSLRDARRGYQPHFFILFIFYFLFSSFNFLQWVGSCLVPQTLHTLKQPFDERRPRVTRFSSITMAAKTLGPKVIRLLGSWSFLPPASIRYIRVGTPGRRV